MAENFVNTSITLYPWPVPKLIASQPGLSNYITNSVSNLTNYPTYTYASTTFPTYSYASSTYYLATNPSNYITATSVPFTVSGATTTNSYANLVSTTGYFGNLIATSTVSLPNNSITNTFLANSTISGIALGSNLNSLSADGTLTLAGGYNGSTTRTVGLNLGNANTWTGTQTFGNTVSTNATTTKLAVTGLLQPQHNQAAWDRLVQRNTATNAIPAFAAQMGRSPAS